MERADWGELLNGFQEHLRAEKGLAPLTVRNYRTDLEPLRQFMDKQVPADFDGLDRRVLRAYLAWLHELGYVRPSIVRKLSVLRTFLHWQAKPARYKNSRIWDSVELAQQIRKPSLPAQATFLPTH